MFGPNNTAVYLFQQGTCWKIGHSVSPWQRAVEIGLKRFNVHSYVWLPAPLAILLESMLQRQMEPVWAPRPQPPRGGGGYEWYNLTSDNVRAVQGMMMAFSALRSGEEVG